MKLVLSLCVAFVLSVKAAPASIPRIESEFNSIDAEMKKSEEKLNNLSKILDMKLTNFLSGAPAAETAPAPPAPMPSAPEKLRSEFQDMLKEAKSVQKEAEELQ